MRSSATVATFRGCPVFGVSLLGRLGSRDEIERQKDFDLVGLAFDPHQPVVFFESFKDGLAAGETGGSVR